MAIEQVLTEPTLLSIYTNIEHTFFVEYLYHPASAILAVTSMLAAAFLFYKPATALLSLLFILTVALLLHRKKRKLASELVLAREQLAATEDELQELKARTDTAATFKTSLNEAEITTRLQQPRLSAQHRDSIKTPERYQFIQSLTERGMDGEEIASVLSISTHEADQLVKLSKLAATAA